MAITIKRCIQHKGAVAWGSLSDDGHSMGDLCITIVDKKADIPFESLEKYAGIKHMCWG